MHSHKEHLHDVGIHLSPLEEGRAPIPDLNVGDIVLVRHKKSLGRFFLRRVTDSYWDHVAMVIFPKNAGKGYSSNIIIEAIQYGWYSGLRRGIEVHKLDKYLNNPKKFDVGIKRVEDLSEEMRLRIRSFALINIDAPYYHLWSILFFIAWLSETFKKWLLRHQRYSCSALVQKSYYETLPWDERESVVFARKGDSPIELQDIVSPGDIASSQVSSWIWNERGGDI